jgi:hypothetical protein
MAFRSAAGRPGRWVAGALVLALCATGVSACGGNRAARTMQSQEAGEQGFSLFRRRAPAAQQQAFGTIGVNAYLWRASLDTLAFMPLSSADPYGGIIVTDWYNPPEKPDERFKATVYILDTRLRADGLNVAIQRQTRAGTEWQTAATSPQTEEQIESAILTRARQIRTTGR